MPIQSRHDYTTVGNIGFLKIETLTDNNKFSVRNDRLKYIDELRVLVESTGRKYRIFKKDFEILRHHKHYGESLFGEKCDCESWYYEPSNLEELTPELNAPAGKTSVDLPMTTQASRWDKGKETIANYKNGGCNK